MITKSLHHPSFWLLLLGATLILSSCGSSAVSSKTTTASQKLPSPTPTSTQSVSTFDNGVPSQEFSFEVYGDSATTVTPELATDNLLQVQLTAEAGGRNLGTNTYTNFSANYNCATFKVILEMDTGAGWTQVSQQTTSPLNVKGTSGCTNGVASQTINYSKYLFPGEKRIRIKIQALASDFYCQLYTACLNAIQRYGQVTSDCTWMAGQTNMQSYVCPMKTIYQYHTVDGKALLQVNGTALSSN